MVHCPSAVLGGYTKKQRWVLGPRLMGVGPGLPCSPEGAATPLADQKLNKLSGQRQRLGKVRK